ncbi:expressed unknown protein [Seminavis robusta]|uniref:Uncharacterized protein n=1 Tax=Seminavis robusta TaxID=568900 RepID=A0A9N8EU08_9STRA|nr:expressed unknown protein [Seminavis robusta]|eukprot:Sro1625_g286751.1  (118) ;mRNA; f:10725-11078
MGKVPRHRRSRSPVVAAHGHLVKIVQLPWFSKQHLHCSHHDYKVATISQKPVMSRLERNKQTAHDPSARCIFAYKPPVNTGTEAQRPARGNQMNADTGDLPRLFRNSYKSNISSEMY